MNKSLALLALLATSCATTDQDGDYSWLDSGDVQFDLPVPADAEFHESRVIVGFWDNDRPDQLALSRDRLVKVRSFSGLPAALYQVEAGQDVVEVVEELRATGRYRWVEPDYVRHASVSDPYFGYQWHMEAVGAEDAWALSTGAGTLVAVIDTGVSSGPYDGIGAISSSGYDFANGDSNPADDNGHGTHVAGTIAQATNNGAGVAGLAYGATILPVKVLNRYGSGYTSDIVDGINYAVAQGADVINMSLGSSSYSSTEASAVYNAYISGVFVACASGNAGGTSVDYPAAYSGAVAVGATGYGNYRVSYSNRGSALDLVAPGGDTSRDYNGDGYVDGVLQETFSGSSWGYYFFQGTSMASPHVAAAAALLMAEGATNVEAQDALESTALDLGTSGWDSSYGHGLIQPAEALAAFGGGSDPVDADGDGYSDTTDCDDTDSSVYPGAPETCGDGIDQDCDGSDEACPAPDNDGDGWDETVDCDDGDSSVYPGAPETCGDGIDQDCDGSDEACPVDADGDGYTDTEDCDDGDSSVYPGAPETCGDGIDQDCDGSDESCSSAPTISDVTYYTSGRYLFVWWSTDEATTGRVCNARGSCSSTTALGTSHSAYVRKSGGTFTITATDVDGETDTYTAAY